MKDKKTIVFGILKSFIAIGAALWLTRYIMG